MRIGIILGGVFFLIAAPVYAETQRSFSDVPPEHPAYEAVEHLKAQGIIGGYADGTFKPEKNVNRAEAVKIVAAPHIAADALEELKKESVGFHDVPQDAWYKPFLLAAVNVLGFIDGPSKRPAFEGGRPVLKSEFIKMVLVANGVDAAQTFSEIRDPLALDVQSVDEWYYPYMRTALAYSMTMADESDALKPGRELSRADVAILMHRFLMFQEKRRTQALLSESEGEIGRILDALGRNDTEAAIRASTRSVLSARGAHLQQPDETLVRGAVKISQAFQELVYGYLAALAKDFSSTIAHAKRAWELGGEARSIEPDMKNIIDQVQQIAKSMADSARQLQAGQ